MDILYAQIALCSLFGLLTGLIASYFVLDHEKPMFSFLCAIIGATVGVWFSVAWIFLTDGLVVDAIMIFGVVMTTFLVLYLILSRIREINRNLSVMRFKFSGILAFLIVIGMAVFLIVSASPAFEDSLPSAAFTSIMDDKTMYLDDTVGYVVDSTLAQEMYYGSGVSTPIDISIDSVSVDFPSFSANPGSGDYLSYQVTFSISGYDWTHPYVKVAVVHDTDGSGGISGEDKIWGSHMSKAVTSSGKWRSSVYYENNQPKGQLTLIGTSEGLLFMPIFHANDISVWQNDNGKTFPLNTPEGYKAPHDQMSWEWSGTAISLKEGINSMAVVSTGNSVTLKGKIYCHSQAASYFSGTNFLWVGAYDLRFQEDPFEIGMGSPISSKVSAFNLENEIPPISVDAGGPYSGNVGDTIQFSGTATGGTPPYDSWSWAFSDGVTRTGQNPTRTFDSAGSYTVTLTVTDSAGKKGTDSANIEITDPISDDPIANAGGPYSGYVNDVISFSGSATGGTPPYDSWSWAFCDGVTRTGQNPTRTFDSAGSYTVTLTVTDTAGNTGTSSANIEITHDSGNGNDNGNGVPDIDIDIATYVLGGSLFLGGLGVVVFGRKFL